MVYKTLKHYLQGFSKSQLVVWDFWTINSGTGKKNTGFSDEYISSTDVNKVGWQFFEPTPKNVCF